MTLQNLNQQFGIPQHIEFREGKGGLPTAFIANSFASASVTLYGAHVVSYVPHNEKDLLWLSPLSAFEPGKPIRGGIPVCFPWFGPHPSNSQLPVHGFARLQNWEVTHTSITPEKTTKLILSLQDNEETRALWPFTFKLDLEVTIGAQLEVTLVIHNTDNEAISTTNSLHTYFQVKNLENCHIGGLGKQVYYDPAERDSGLYQEELLLHISKEENRRYYAHIGECVLHDPDIQRDVHITKSGSKVTVVWNPWKETVQKIGDIANEDYLSFVCIEQANTYDDTIALEPGTKHALGLRAGILR